MLRFLAFLGFAFLYIPLALLILFSFNDNDRASIWTGFSAKWYAKLWQNEALLEAAQRSLLVAVTSATIATVLGLMTAYTLVRFHKMRGRTLLEGMTTSPLVMPDIITGFSLLVLFTLLRKVAFGMGWSFNLGLGTIIIAHTTLCMAYVTVTIRSRLLDMDTSIEEAAQDLGARPLSVFFQITLPVIAPSVVAGWLLAFTISLDDVVLASSVSGGGGSTTLPVMVFSQVRMGVTPEFNALASVMIVGVAILVTTGLQIQNRLLRR